MAKEIAAHHPDSIFLDMERAADRAQLQGAEAFFAAHRNRLVVLDEVQAMPDIFKALRPEIDAHIMAEAPTGSKVNFYRTAAGA